MQRLSRSREVLVPAFEVLGHAKRLDLLRKLAAGAATTGGLAKALELCEWDVSHHLGLLARAGLVRSDSGRTHLHHLTERMKVETEGGTVSLTIDLGEGEVVRVTTSAAPRRDYHG